MLAYESLALMTAQEKMQRRNALRFRASMQKWFFMILVALILYRNVTYFSSVHDFFSMTFSDALLTPPGVTGIGASPPGKQNEPIGFQSQSDDGMWSPTWSLVCIVATCGIVYIHRKNRKQTPPAVLHVGELLLDEAALLRAAAQPEGRRRGLRGYTHQ